MQRIYFLCYRLKLVIMHPGLTTTSALTDFRPVGPKQPSQRLTRSNSRPTRSSSYHTDMASSDDPCHHLPFAHSGLPHRHIIRTDKHPCSLVRHHISHEIGRRLYFRRRYWAANTIFSTITHYMLPRVSDPPHPPPPPSIQTGQSWCVPSLP